MPRTQLLSCNARLDLPLRRLNGRRWGRAEGRSIDFSGLVRGRGHQPHFRMTTSSDEGVLNFVNFFFL